MIMRLRGIELWRVAAADALFARVSQRRKGKKGEKERAARDVITIARYGEPSKETSAVPYSFYLQQRGHPIRGVFSFNLLE